MVKFGTCSYQQSVPLLNGDDRFPSTYGLLRARRDFDYAFGVGVSV
jgi:hypothetical protein